MCLVLSMTLAACGDEGASQNIIIDENNIYLAEDLENKSLNLTVNFLNKNDLSVIQIDDLVNINLELINNQGETFYNEVLAVNENNNDGYYNYVIKIPFEEFTEGYSSTGSMNLGIDGLEENIHNYNYGCDSFLCSVDNTPEQFQVRVIIDNEEVKNILKNKAINGSNVDLDEYVNVPIEHCIEDYPSDLRPVCPINYEYLGGYRGVKLSFDLADIQQLLVVNSDQTWDYVMLLEWELIDETTGEVVLDSSRNRAEHVEIIDENTIEYSYSPLFLKYSDQQPEQWGSYTLRLY